MQKSKTRGFGISITTKRTAARSRARHRRAAPDPRRSRFGQNARDRASHRLPDRGTKGPDLEHSRGYVYEQSRRRDAPARPATVARTRRLQSAAGFDVSQFVRANPAPGHRKAERQLHAPVHDL